MGEAARKISRQDVINGIRKGFSGGGYKPPINLCCLTAQDIVPFTAVHEKDNLIETYPGLFTRMYLIGENNYQTETEECQQSIFIELRSFFNSIGANCECAISVFNRNVNLEEFKAKALMKETGDELDYLRREMNEIIIDRMKEGRNGLEKLKFLTMGVHTNSYKKAVEMFNHRIDREVAKSFKKVGSVAVPMEMEKRLEILHDLHNIDNQGEFLTHTRVPDELGRMQEISSFDLDNIRGMGLSVKDVVCPSSVRVFPRYMMFGKTYVCAMRIDAYPSSLPDDFFIKLTDVPFNMISTMNIQPIPTMEANRIVNKNIRLARNQKIEERRALLNQNLPEDMISLETEEKVQKAQELREEMIENDEKLFKTVHTVVFWADSKDKLREYTENLTTICQSNVVGVHVMEEMQEEGFQATLPLLYNALPKKMKRTLKSSSLTCACMPFSAMELSDSGGIHYSMNLASRNLILYDRLQTQNFNGFILGTPGSGKSFTAKVEMLNVLLGSNAKCIVIDPESEYSPLAKLIGGEVIKIMPGGKWHINPLAITPDYEYNENDEEESEIPVNPVLGKAAFILRLMETIIKSPFGLSSIQETIIDECVHSLYAPFMKDGVLQPIPPELMPTLTDLQVAFSKRSEPEARELAYALRLYTGNGSLNVFGFQSNVDTKNRFVVYDIKDVGEKLKPLAMLIILDSIQNTLFENRKRGRNTWFWVDECHLLFLDESTAVTLSTIFKRARKYGGVPTGISQNIEDLLKSTTCRTMLSNCNFIQMLNQAPLDRENLRTLLNLSDSQVATITSAPKGQGLIYTGSNCVGFHSVFPKNNSIYRCLTSSMKEIKEYEEAERRARAKLLEAG